MKVDEDAQKWVSWGLLLFLAVIWGLSFIMIKRTLYFSNPSYLNLKDQQLQIDLPHLKNLGEKESKKRVNFSKHYATFIYSQPGL